MIKEVEQYIKKYYSDTIKIGVVLGSGLDKFCENLESPIRIPYNEIPNFRKVSVKGHKGEFVSGKIYNKNVICANGRFHYYEGYQYNDVAVIIDVFQSLGCKIIIMTNASGCVVREWNVGDLMLIKGHLDYSFIKSKEIPSIISDEWYDFSLLNQIQSIATKENILLRRGVYTWTTGPSYETASEIKEIRQLGGHAVGMSGLPEIERTYHLGMKLIGICCLTNYASGISGEELTHTEVVQKATESHSSFIQLIKAIIKEINPDTI
tara:strand:- start:57 stop:851 length:795 start_codon:yes stop_codon:yes gene_type:complete